ncbi:hypothetical protein ACVI1N_000108 [Sinorhizobium medicae]
MALGGDNRPLSLFDKYTQYLDAGRMVLNLPPVSLFTTNADAPRAVSLPPPRDNGCFGVMKRRRSYRGFDGSAAGAVTEEQLRYCRFSRIGTVGLARADLVELPLKTTPSEGTRNRLCASSSAKLGGHACWSCGLTECEFLVLSQVVHVDVAIGLHPVFVGFDGEGADES